MPIHLSPSQDPWYTAPEGFENATPGTVLRFRLAPEGLVSNVGNCSAAYNVLYRSTNSRHEAAWAVTTVLVPTMKTSFFGRALLSYQVPYDSASIDASPSASMYQPGALGLAHIQKAPAHGWHVSVPDYEGPLASFTLGIQSGQATLDAVRAVLSLAGTVRDGHDIGLSSDSRYALWGYSGGSIASEWAAELQPTYAPELKFSGLAVGGIITNIWRVLESVSGKMLAGLVPSGLLGMTTQYPEARSHLISHLKPEKRAEFLAANDMDSDTAMRQFAFHPIFDYFIGGEADLLDSKIQNIIATEGTMGLHGTPAMPIFAYACIADELTPIAGADALLAKYAESGARILFHRNTVGSHLAEFENGRDRALVWLEGVLAEDPASAVSREAGLTVADVKVVDGDIPSI